MTVALARIVLANGVAHWRCPNCGQKLAEIIGGRVVISVGHCRVSIAVASEPDQVCWKCGQVSSLPVPLPVSQRSLSDRQL